MDPIEAALLSVYFITALVLKMSRTGGGNDYEKSDKGESVASNSMSSYNCGNAPDHGKSIEAVFPFTDTKQEMV